MPFAILVDGSPAEVFAGQEFTSTQFKITTEDEAAWSFSPIGSMIDKAYGHLPSALDAWDANDRARFGVMQFELPIPPDGKRLEGYTLALEDDAVVATGEFADPIVPQEVLRVQGRLQLLAEGLLVGVEAAVAGADAVTKEYWASTPKFRRDNAILTAMWAALGRTPEQLDATFIAAANIPV